MGIFNFKNNQSDQNIEDVAEFYDAIDRSHLTKKLSADRPYVYFTMEVYDKQIGIKGGGGLGILAADTRRIAEQLEIPLTLVTPFYPEELHQSIYDLSQMESRDIVHPEDYNFELVGVVNITTYHNTITNLSVYQKILGSTRFLTIYEPNFKELYSGDGNGDHRLYQEVSLGFGGYAALKLTGLRPAVIQLNETATFFAALARLDELCNNGMNLYEAIVYVRKHTLYTNHTLVQAAESEFTLEQFNSFVFPNIKSKALKNWLKSHFSNNRLKLSSITIEIAEAKNGVSRLHAEVANYHDINGEKVKFKDITNGIDIERWVLPEILKFYKDNDVLDKFNLPSENYIKHLHRISASDIRNLKSIGRTKLNQLLESRLDQYGKRVHIPENAIVFDFKRRFADYKRPWMPFEDINRLKQILTHNNAHYIFAGKVHQGDRTMHDRLRKVLDTINSDPVLKRRVHYFQDYDEELAYGMTVGSDAAINVPIVGLEACGTSWMKDIANLKILISTADGGVADIVPIACLEVSGKTYQEEVESLYAQMEQACRIQKDDKLLESEIERQLEGYLPVISGTRMIRDYLKFLFNK